MNRIVTRHYLRQRFWIATFVLLAALVASAGLMSLAMVVQADRGNYIAAFNRLSNATTRLELELVRLSRLDGGEMADRAQVRAAFVDVLTEFRAICNSEADDPATSDRHAPHVVLDDNIDRLATEFGIDGICAAKEYGLDADAMPEALAEIWLAARSGAADTGFAPLEPSIGRLLMLSAPLARGKGGLNAADRQGIREIEALAAGQVRPMMTRATNILDSLVDRSGRVTIICVLALAGFGVTAALSGFFVVFRPLERVVMASQAEIIAQRDKAVAARIAKRDFLSLVSHELRTPMNGVLGVASLLAASDLKPGQRKQVEIIRSSGKTLLALVDDILDFSKLEAGSLKLEDEDFSIEEVISDVVTLLRAGAAAKRLELSVRLDARLPERSRGDANRLRQIVTNLVGNAIKFTDSGKIGIAAHKASASPGPRGGCELELVVSDTGIGIPADKTELIFERFTQIDGNARRRCGGTGLGLSICKQLVDRMGGRIRVESTPGAGSTFFVRIPLAPAAAPAAGPEWRAGIARYRTSPGAKPPPLTGVHMCTGS